MDSTESKITKKFSHSPMDSRESTAVGKSEISLKRKKQRSLAEFFAENKKIAWFENPGKSLYTTVRELVENALDSAESISVLPWVEVKIEEISRSQYNTMIHGKGIDETVKANEKGLEKNSAFGKKVKKGRGTSTSFYRVTCKDNGRGMAHNDITNMFGRGLDVFGTRYGVKQTRGKYGLGAKMALIWSKMSTGLPIEISTSIKNQNYTTDYSLDIDIERNNPIVVHKHIKEHLDDKESWHGAEIKVVIEGNWKEYGSEILKYMRQTAVITPYAEFKFEYVAADEENVVISCPRRSENMPPVPVETKYHPSSVDVYIIERLIRQTKCQNLLEFLCHEFVNVGKSQAKEIIGEMGPGVTSKTKVNSLTLNQSMRMHELFQEANFFDDPSGGCLSPAGEDNLCEGIAEELLPEMVVTLTASAQVYQGHPFIVEAGVCLGGKDLKLGLNIFRFANRVPLLFEECADVVTITAMNKINWNRYQVNLKRDKIGVFVNIVSTKIPFRGTGMEYIGYDISEIADAVQTCLEQCCTGLKSEIVRTRELEAKRKMKSNVDRIATIIYNQRGDSSITKEFLAHELHEIFDN